MIPKMEMLNPKNCFCACVCNSVEWTDFDICFGVKVGLGLRILNRVPDWALRDG